MAARPLRSGRIALGFVSIPVRFYTAVSEKKVSFNQLHADCGARVKKPTRCPDHGDLEAREIATAYEVEPDKFVVFTAEELKALERGGDPNVIRISETVPASSVPLTHLRDVEYLGPDKGGARSYRLLAMALERARAVAVGQVGCRSRDDLVIVRPHEGGLVVHGLHYANEVRSFAEVEADVSELPTRAELELARTLVARMLRPAFDAGRFEDGAAKRVKAFVDRKVAGDEIVVPPTAAEENANLILAAALEASIEALGPGPRKASGSRSTARRRAG